MLLWIQVSHKDGLSKPIEAPCSKLQGIFDRKEVCHFQIRSLCGSGVFLTDAELFHVCSLEIESAPGKRVVYRVKVPVCLGCLEAEYASLRSVGPIVSDPVRISAPHFLSRNRVLTLLQVLAYYARKQKSPSSHFLREEPSMTQ